MCRGLFAKVGPTYAAGPSRSRLANWAEAWAESLVPHLSVLFYISLFFKYNIIQWLFAW